MVAQGIVPFGDDHAENKGGTLGGEIAGQFIGFGGWLKRWRHAAGLTQTPVAKALGMGVRTYRNVEKGAAAPRFTKSQCEALADLLGLDKSERHALLLYNVGTTLSDPQIDASPELRRALRLLIDRQMPSPTYLTDRNWNVLAYNQAMAEWWPWVMESRANLMRWALTNPEARTQYHDWDMHAGAYVRLLKFAQATHKGNDELVELIAEVRLDPDVERIWCTQGDLEADRDGHVFRMIIPALGWETVEVVSHVLYPASMPSHRFVVITWVEAEDSDEETDALGGKRNAWAHADAGPPAAPQPSSQAEADAARRRAARALTARLVVDSADEAAALAGPDGIPLPALSALAGPGCRLTLSPENHSVVWAIQEAPGEWGVTQLGAGAVVDRVQAPIFDPDARAELKLLLRASLPDADQLALGRLHGQLPQADLRAALLREIFDDLREVETRPH
ncbi:helix-turn-helix transcriptional regulator [Streptomyces sp. NPDC047014]|uniref:helix-turn-helix transcriptional regulator n=1 Tax=Streptomyces sp. NPDC047014 TaxID=3155736 RepID=UPI0033C4C459